jgi:DNA recombination protein RmuC
MSVSVIVLAVALVAALAALAFQYDRRKRAEQESSILSVRLASVEQQLAVATAARDAALHELAAVTKARDTTLHALQESRISVARLEVEVDKANELAAAQIGLLNQTQEQLEEKFRALASEALHANSQMLFDRARDQLATAVQPVGDSLRLFETKVQDLENSRVSHYEGLRAQIQSMAVAQKELQQVTDQLKTALRNPAQRGRWGEMQLRRTLELTGMIEHCDFQQQETLFGDRLRRPDVVVKLPNDREIAIDAKVPLDAYLRATEAEAPFRDSLLADHARQVKAHVKALAEKSYWDGLNGSPEFVIAFLPLESIYSAALEHDSELLNYGVLRRVLLATPTTLIALLFAVAYGWRERQLAHNAEEIREIGGALYRNLLTLHGRVEKLGASLNTAVSAYNEAVTSFDGRVLSNARKLHELKAATGEELARLDTLDLQAKRLISSDWSETPQ